MADRKMNNLYPTSGRSTETAGNDADRFTNSQTENQQFDDEGNFENDHSRSGRGNIGGAQYPKYINEEDRLMNSKHRDENPYERNWNEDNKEKNNEGSLAELESDLTPSTEKKQWSIDHEENYEGRVSQTRKDGKEISGVQSKNGYGQSRPKYDRYKE